MSESQGSSFPASPPQTPGYPNNPQPLVFDTFEGMNTKASRPAIDDKQAYWIDGFMPLGKSNLRTIPGLGPRKHTFAGAPLVAMFFANLNDLSNNTNIGPVGVVVTGDGAVWAFSTEAPPDSAQLPVLPVGSLFNPNPSFIGFSQWGAKYILISNTTPDFHPQGVNGYWVWDGVSIFAAGTLSPDITILNGGGGYTSQPTYVAYTATGAMPVQPTLNFTLDGGAITASRVLSPGSGLGINDTDVLIWLSGGGSTGTTAYVQASIAAGAITGFTVIDGGAGYAGTPSVVFLGGGGAGATATVTLAGDVVSVVNITAGGSGYTSPPLVVIENADNPVAQITANGMPFGVAGSAIETYQSRVWISNGPLVQYSGSGSVADFSSANGGGAFSSNDSFLRRAFQSMKQSNGFLYLLADSSINNISNVQTNATTGITTFSNQNTDPQVGTSWPASVQVFSRKIVFANSFGVHVCIGGETQKISAALDGIYSTTPLDGFFPSSAVCDIFGISVYVLLLPVIDPVSKSQENELFMWDGRKWWASGQDVPLTFIATQEIDSVLTAWGTDGVNVYPMFQRPSVNFTKTIQSKLWDRPGYFTTKAMTRLYGMTSNYVLDGQDVIVSLDTEAAQQEYVIPQGGSSMSWTNNSGGTISWTNNASQPMNWFSASGGVSIFGPLAVGQQGRLTGFSMTTNASDLALISLMSIDQIYSTNI